MNEVLFICLILFAAIIAAIIIVIYIRRFVNIERLAIIEKGVNPEIFVRPKKTVSGALRASLLFIGIGSGLLMGYWLDYAYDMDEVAYFSMLFLFGGIGLGAAYLIEEKKRGE